MKKMMLALAATAALGMVATPSMADGAKVFMKCMGCHGKDGSGMGPNPAIKGKTADEVKAALAAYKSGERKHPAMRGVAMGLKGSDVDAVADYIATLK